jgi:hypothetical protein
MRIVNSLPQPVHNGPTATAAIFIERRAGPVGWIYTGRTEKVFERDGRWTVRRNGELVPIDSMTPPPAALMTKGGTVFTLTRSWPSIEAFGREHGMDVAAFKKEGR